MKFLFLTPFIVLLDFCINGLVIFCNIHLYTGSFINMKLMVRGVFMTLCILSYVQASETRSILYV